MAEGRIVFGVTPAPELGKGPNGYKAKQAASFAMGVHPATWRALRTAGGTCGGCLHHYTVHYAKAYHKCELAPRNTGGPATDIRVRWPACELFEPGDAQEVHPAG